MTKEEYRAIFICRTTFFHFTKGSSENDLIGNIRIINESWEMGWQNPSAIQYQIESIILEIMERYYGVQNTLGEELKNSRIMLQDYFKVGQKSFLRWEKEIKNAGK